MASTALICATGRSMCGRTRRTAHRHGHGRSVRTRAFLAKQYTADLEPSRRSDFHRARPVIPPECSPLCFVECHHGRRRHRLLGFQIPIQLLAADHRDPRRPYSDRHRPHVGGPWLDFFKPGTPAFPEYPSAHASISGSAAFILASIFRGQHLLLHRHLRIASGDSFVLQFL